MLTAALTFAAAVLGAVVGRNWERTTSRPDPVDQAYNTLPAGRPGLRIDPSTGSHDELPIRPDIRQMLTDYCDGMWHHTQPTTHDREYPL